MKKVFLVILGIGFFSAAALAQKGKNEISPALDVTLPIGEFSDVCPVGLGVTVKGLYGVGEAGQITLTTGYSTFGAKKEIKDAIGASKMRQSIIPILAGYRHNFDGFYAEPQVGYGIWASKIKGGIIDGSESEGAFTWAAGVGYVYKSFDAGLRYQSSHKNGSSRGMIGLRVGYNFSL